MKSEAFVETFRRGTEWAATGEAPKRVVFRDAQEQVWTDPDLPADWSPFQFLVMEMRLSSPQRFDLRVHDASGVRTREAGACSGPVDPRGGSAVVHDAARGAGPRPRLRPQQVAADDLHQPLGPAGAGDDR